MNSFLAELYGTRDTIGAAQADDTEKLAQAQLLGEFFSSEGIDVEKLDDSTIAKVAHQLFGDDSAFGKVAEEDGDKGGMPEGLKKNMEEKKEEKKDDDEDDDDDESDSEKMAQADMLGRIMAHAFVQEKGEIEKQAAAKQKEAASQEGPSPLDMLAIQRAEEILKEAGVQQEQSEEEKLAAAVNARAIELLKEAGYTFQD